MKPLRITMLSRSLALCALLAACVNTQRLTAQTTPRDSLVRSLTVAKSRADSLAALVSPAIAKQCTFSVQGFFRPACQWYAPLFRRDSIDIAASLARASRLGVDTVRVTVTKTDTVTKTVTVTKTDTLRLTKTDTVRLTITKTDTLRITTTIHDTVFVRPPPAPVTVATVSTSLTASTLAPGKTTTARAVVKDSAGATLTRAVAWSSTNTAVGAVSDSGLVTAISPGTSAIRATVDTKSSFATLTVVAPVDTTPLPPKDTSRTVELPRVFLTTTVASTPSTGRTLNVSATGNLQLALDSARYGDQILVAACATFRGNYFYGVPKAGIAGQYVTVRSAGAIPSEGTRTSPAFAAAFTSCYPKIVGIGGVNALASRPGANHWRFIGLEITVDSTVANNQGTILVGDASEAQNTLAGIPSDIIFDRLYVHGAANVDMRKCIALNSARTSVIDSYVSDCHSLFDAQAITGTNGPGPFKIVNNYLEGAAEGIAWGGGDPHIAGLVPADIEIRRNHIFKPLAWQATQWSEKNIIESKNSTRVLVEGNVLENSWSGGQVGYTLALWSVNQDGTCSWCVTSHWTFRNNVIVNASAGVNLTSMFSFPGRVNPVPMHHIAITNNVWLGLTGNRTFQIDTIPFTTIEHNTAMNAGGTAFVFDPKGRSAGLVIRNNILSGYYGVTAPWGGNLDAWNAVGGGIGSQWMTNIIVSPFEVFNPIPGTWYLPSTTPIGFVSGSGIDGLALPSTTTYKGTDGKAVGADIAAVKAATAGVVQAVSTARLRVTKP